MRKFYYLITAAVLVCVVIVVGALAFGQPKAEAASAGSSGLAAPEDLEYVRSQLPDVSNSAVLATAHQPAMLWAQGVQDVKVFSDSYGDSLLAEDLASLAVGYDPADATYNFLVSFHAPFVGLLSSESVLILLDVDSNYSTGYKWESLGLGSDYSIDLRGGYSGSTANLFATPTDNSATWSVITSLSGIEDTGDDSIFVVVPASHLGSPNSFRMFMVSQYTGYYDTYYDFLPDSGYVTYARSSATTTTLAPTTTTTLAPTTTTTLASTTTTTDQTTTTTTPPTGVCFTDVPSSHPYSAQITELAGRDIINGFPNGMFQPNAWVTRQQFAKMIVKTMGYPVSEADVCPFLDVPTNVSTVDPLYPDKYVAVCAAHGVTLGKTDTTFDPYGEITRAQLITMVTRAAEIGDPPVSYAPPFGQYDNTHYPFSRKAAYAGILSGLQGMGSDYDFYGSATRGEVCLVLYNLLQESGAQSDLDLVTVAIENSDVVAEGVTFEISAFVFSGVWAGVIVEATNQDLDPLAVLLEKQEGEWVVIDAGPVGEIEWTVYSCPSDVGGLLNGDD